MLRQYRRHRARIDTAAEEDPDRHVADQMQRRRLGEPIADFGASLERVGVCSGGDAVGTAAELFAENSDEVTPEPVRT